MLFVHNPELEEGQLQGIQINCEKATAKSKTSLEQVRVTLLEKTALFTNRHDFTNEEIVNAYSRTWHVEAVFKQLKNMDHLMVRPIFHWTDEKMRVHVFTCVLAYRLSYLPNRELREHGIYTNVNEVLDEMSKIKSVDTFFAPLGMPNIVKI